MSVILDALRKAQDERRMANSRHTDGTEVPPRKRIRDLYYLLGAVAVLLGVMLFVPDVQQFLRYGTGASRTPPLVHQHSKETPSTVATESPKPEAQKTAEGTNKRSPRELTEPSKQALEEKPLPKISWAPSIQVPVPGRQIPVSKGMLSAPEPKLPFTGADQEQSITVKAGYVKDSATEMYNNALKETALGRVEEARRSYLSVLADRPDDAETLNNLGVLVMNGGNTKDALAYFRMALDSRADYPKAHNNLGMLYMKEGQNRPAEEHLRQALKLDPDGVEPYLNLSALLRSEGRFQEASQILAVLLQKGHKEPIIHLSYAIISDEMGDYAGAINYYRQYLSQALQDPERSAVAERLKVLDRYQSSGNR